ncbi:MAG: DUF2062 domain-containing protein [Paenibacillaceae bacterium]|nr:DUF2062 domain-containing protein [Paenibacillaceae bacterium]
MEPTQAKRVIKANRSRVKKTGRWLKYKYLMLLRAKGGPSKVAKGFSIGLAIEMFTLPTFGTAALLIIPLVYMLRASLPGALIGFLLGKLVYPLFFFLNKKVGKAIVPEHFADYIHFLPNWLEKFIKGAVDLIVGGMVVGTILGILAYFPIKWMLEYYTHRRKEKRKRRKAQLMVPHIP